MKGQPIDLGLGFTLKLKFEEGEEGDALEAFHTEDVA
jgi:hypothetical protein